MAIDEVVLNIDADGQLALGVVLALIMFGVALDLRLADFRAVLKKPMAPLVGMLGQVLVLPATSWALTMLLQPAPSVALGMIIVAACPGGNLSNLITHLARGNTALSVCVTGLSSVAAVITTPLNILFWASLNPGTAKLLRDVQIEPVSFLLSTFMLLAVPMALGMLLAHYLPRAAERLRRFFQPASFLFLVAFIAAAAIANGKYFVGFLSDIMPLVILHNALALGLGYGISRLFRLDAPDTRAITIEVGMQNSGLGLALILNQFDALGGAALIAAGWGIWHIVSGWTLATIWRWRDRKAAAS
ncbi:bile acid:sodium symporter family protein [Ferrovibrio sp.]|uniref:bile acid:sodium symporter family protein n=1 Tax=Ferrovibrio sp. TaxID=1917215 RepID=UPI0025BE62AA|nr:bile acid:sodium symporter family protein [Ferrovibrio sp.]MBX3456396.1 bile acid:sodium symporter family protein [Ferrovibrio sp.]